ncbi:hypothetical protein FWK35_00033602, partial [Aphis craccivora]
MNICNLFCRLTNHLRSESFFVYNDNLLSLDSNLTVLQYIVIHTAPNVQPSGTHLPVFLFFKL